VSSEVKPPILFIHGAFTRARRWRPWLSYFTAAGYECAAPSLPGHDPSDRRQLVRLTLADYVDAMLEVVARFDRPPMVIGHSMGGLIAQHVAANSKCAGLVLIASTPPWRTGAPLGAVPYTLRYVLPVAIGQPIRASRAVALKLVLHDLLPAEQEELMPNMAYESGKAYRTLVLGNAPVDASAVRCPVLVVSGGADRLLKPSVGEGLARFYRAEHFVVPGRGHSLIADSILELVAAPVLGWIEHPGAGQFAPAPSLLAEAVV
jgi:pimeloyl-ACP methyl ester carboxylesterase